MEKEAFYDRVVQLYQQEFLPMLDALLEEGLDRYESRILPAAAMNQVRWSAADQEGQTKVIRNYLTERGAFLKDLWTGETEYCWVSMYVPDYHGKVYARLPGEAYLNPTYWNTEDALGWYDPVSGEYVDISQPVAGDIVLYMQYRQEPEQTVVQWIRASVSWLAPFGALLVLLLVLILRDITLHKWERRSCHGAETRRKISP